MVKSQPISLPPVTVCLLETLLSLFLSSIPPSKPSSFLLCPPSIKYTRGFTSLSPLYGKAGPYKSVPGAQVYLFALPEVSKWTDFSWLHESEHFEHFPLDKTSLHFLHLERVWTLNSWKMLVLCEFLLASSDCWLILQPIFLWAGGWKRFFGQGENQIPEAS